MLEHLLLTVGNFSEQLVYQLDKETQERLIESYYGLDDAYCREVVGKKLRELDSVTTDQLCRQRGISGMNSAQRSSYLL